MSVNGTDHHLPPRKVPSAVSTSGVSVSMSGRRPTRSTSFADVVGIGMQRRGSRHEWEFQKTHAEGYREMLRRSFTGAGTHGHSPSESPIIDQTPRTTPKSLAVLGGSGVATPESSKAVRRLSPSTPPIRAEQAETNMLTLSPWHGLLDAPLYADTLGCPLFLFCRILRRLIRVLARLQSKRRRPAYKQEKLSSDEDKLRRSLVVVIHTAEATLQRAAAASSSTAATDGAALNITPAHVAKCELVRRASRQLGYSQRFFREALTLPRAKELFWLFHVAVCRTFPAEASPNEDASHAPAATCVCVCCGNGLGTREAVAGADCVALRNPEEDSDEAPNSFVRRAQSSFLRRRGVRRVGTAASAGSSGRLAGSSMRQPLAPAAAAAASSQMPAMIRSYSELAFVDSSGEDDDDDDNDEGHRRRRSERARFPKNTSAQSVQPSADDDGGGGGGGGGSDESDEGSDRSGDLLPSRDLASGMGVQLSRLEEMKADVWDVLSPPSIAACAHSTRRRRIFAVVQAVVLVAWATVFATRSLPQFHRVGLGDSLPFDLLEGAFTLLYTAEYVARVFTTPQSRLRAVVEPMNIFLLVSLIPFFTKLVYRWAGGDVWTTHGVIGHIEALTVFRVFKVAYVGESLQKLTAVFKTSGWMLGIGAMILTIFMLVMGDVFYYAELYMSSEYAFDRAAMAWQRAVQPPLVLNGTVVNRKEVSPIQSLLDVYWWSVTTVTTVGYGDVAPVSVLGRVIAGGSMVVGVLVFAVPASVICSHFTLAKSDVLLYEEDKQKRCVRVYIQRICTKTLSADPDVPIFLHHFAMVDSLEAHRLANPAQQDITGPIYRKILWLYRAAREGERETQRADLRRWKKEQQAERASRASERGGGAPASPATPVAAKTTRRARRLHISRMCQELGQSSKTAVLVHDAQAWSEHEKLWGFSDAWRCDELVPRWGGPEYHDAAESLCAAEETISIDGEDVPVADLVRNKMFDEIEKQSGRKTASWCTKVKCFKVLRCTSAHRKPKPVSASELTFMINNRRIVASTLVENAGYRAMKENPAHKVGWCRHLGACPYGLACTFAHRQNWPLRTLKINVQGKPLNASRFVENAAYLVMKDNPHHKVAWCKRGDACKNGLKCTFAHLKPEPILEIQGELVPRSQLVRNKGFWIMKKHPHYKISWCRKHLQGECPDGLKCQCAHRVGKGGGQRSLDTRREATARST